MLALEKYRVDTGGYPSAGEGLESLRRNVGKLHTWRGPYLAGDVPLDPWGRPYIYSFPVRGRESPEVLSYGADGKPGGMGDDADITS
jgi:general secretion pathway protein G